MHSYPVSFAIKEAIGREIDRLEDIGVLERVEFSHWATPIMPVPKSNGTLRLCGDYKVTLNAALEVDQHPQPEPEAGGQHFNTLDLSQVYKQLVLDDAHQGLAALHSPCLWGSLCSSHIPAYYGSRSPWSARCDVLPR